MLPRGIGCACSSLRQSINSTIARQGSHYAAPAFSSLARARRRPSRHESIISSHPSYGVRFPLSSATAAVSPTIDESHDSEAEARIQPKQVEGGRPSAAASAGISNAPKFSGSDSKMKQAGAISTGSSVSAPTRRQRKAPIIVTERAAARIKELLADRSDKVIGVRLGIKRRGCNGLSYTMNYAEAKPKFDEEVFDKGVHVYIDPMALMHIVGTVMDFEETELSSEFTFNNPNAKGSCGCGESFST